MKEICFIKHHLEKMIIAHIIKHKILKKTVDSFKKLSVLKEKLFKFSFVF